MLKIVTTDKLVTPNPIIVVRVFFSRMLDRNFLPLEHFNFAMQPVAVRDSHPESRVFQGTDTLGASVANDELVYGIIGLTHVDHDHFFFNFLF